MDNIQPWCNPFPIWKQSVVPCPVLFFLTCIQIFQKAGQVVWYSHLLRNFPEFIVTHTVKGFGKVNKAEIDVFLELSCFFDNPKDVGNLISGSSAFSKSSLNIWKFTVHMLLKPCLENFEHFFTSGNGNPLQYSCLENLINRGACRLQSMGSQSQTWLSDFTFFSFFTSVWDECNCVVVWAFFGIAFLWERKENWPFLVPWPLLRLPNLLVYWVQHFHSIIF